MDNVQFSTDTQTNVAPLFCTDFLQKFCAAQSKHTITEAQPSVKQSASASAKGKKQRTLTVIERWNHPADSVYPHTSHEFGSEMPCFRVGEAIRCAWCVADNIRQPADCLKLSVCLDHFSRHFKGHSPAEECCQTSTLHTSDATWTLYEASKSIQAINAVTLLQQQQTHFMELMNLMTQQHTEALEEHVRTQTMMSDKFA